MSRLLLSLLLFCLAAKGLCQDTLMLRRQEEYELLKQLLEQDSLDRDEMRFNRDGMFMPLRGLIQTFTHRSFNRLPGPFPDKSGRWADYGLALSPLAATWTLKALGVKSRSTTQRMLVSGGLAAGLTVGLAQTLRWSVTEDRPDGSDASSFPSMHASLAFMSAAILSREYGYISPWITIGGYAAATGTQVLRIEHNAHWMNDVFMGAGIGVVSTNLAYYLTDKILGRKGIAPLPASFRGGRPSGTGTPADVNGPCWGSGFRLVSGTETNGRSLDVADFAEAAPGFDMTGVTLRTSASITTGFEAEWFLGSYLSLSAIGRYTLSQAKLEIPRYDVTAWGEHTRIYHGNIAAGWSYPLLRDVRVGARTLWGIRYNEAVTFRQVAEGHQMGPELLRIAPQLRPAGGAGITIDLLQRYNQTVGFSFDFLHTFGTSFLPNRWVIASSWKAMF